MNAASPLQDTSAQRLRLHSVTLCAVSSSNIQATVQAMQASLAQIEFAQALLFTDRSPEDLGLMASSEIQVIPIEPIRSSQAYSQFMLSELVNYISTSHALIVQWDGHVIDAGRWQDAFLEYDYIGASWPQFDDGFDVGNGGFSLRSQRLMEACQSASFKAHHPEDIAIGRTNRAFLEAQGMRFAPSALADQFAAERSSNPDRTFGYHGGFLMPQVLGIDRFWQIYLQLSDKTSLWHDLGVVLRAVMHGRKGISRGSRLIIDRIRHALGV